MLCGQTNTPPIPEEARKHFVMGETMFKEAKSAANFSQAVVEFAEAVRLAPQWPAARYNLALAKEAAGDYSGAINDLELYQQFKLSDSEGRKVQDKIYALKAKEKMKVSDGAAKDAAEAKAESAAGAGKEIANRIRFIKAIQGDWHVGAMSLSISSRENGNVGIAFDWGGQGAVSNISITKSTLRFTVIPQHGVRQAELSYRFSLSLDNYGCLKGTSESQVTQRGKESLPSGFPAYAANTVSHSDWTFTRQ